MTARRSCEFGAGRLSRESLFHSMVGSVLRLYLHHQLDLKAVHTVVMTWLLTSIRKCSSQQINMRAQHIPKQGHNKGNVPRRQRRHSPDTHLDFQAHMHRPATASVGAFSITWRTLTSALLFMLEEEHNPTWAQCRRLYIASGRGICHFFFLHHNTFGREV